MMKTPLLHRWILVLVCFSVVVAAGAQERNAARLVLADTTFVDVSLGVGGAAGRLRDVYTPAQELRGALDAVSQRKLGPVHLYGHFGYGYDYGWGSTWRGWIDPYETPFMLADSIPGSLSLERYTMEAGAGLSLGGGWSAGLDLAYEVALMAKHKDLRNKNTAMHFRVAPGIYWRSGRWGLGLDLGYERGTERVEYTQVSSSVENVLFDIYGLWVCHASGFASAEPRRFKADNRLFGDFQFDLQLGGLSLHNEAHGSWQQSDQGEVGYNNQRFGSTRSWTWNDALSLKWGAEHCVEAAFTYSTMQGFRPLQRQELDPVSRVRVWVTYGDPVFCYWRRYHTEHLSYRYGTNWQVMAAVDHLAAEHTYTEYPQRFVQRIHTLVPTLGVRIPMGRFALTPRLGYALGYDAYSDDTPWQLSEPLRRQWDYWDGNRYLGALDMEWSFAGGRSYVRAHYGIEASTRTDADGMRHTASLTLGFVF